jgi:hypothetical protein
MLSKNLVSLLFLKYYKRHNKQIVHSKKRSTQIIVRTTKYFNFIFNEIIIHSLNKRVNLGNLN